MKACEFKAWLCHKCPQRLWKSIPHSAICRCQPFPPTLSLQTHEDWSLLLSFCMSSSVMKPWWHRRAPQILTTNTKHCHETGSGDSCPKACGPYIRWHKVTVGLKYSDVFIRTFRHPPFSPTELMQTNSKTEKRRVISNLENQQVPRVWENEFVTPVQGMVPLSLCITCSFMLGVTIL